MDFLLGLLTATVFFLCLFLAYRMGARKAKKPSESKPMNEEERRKIEQYNKHFQALFNYDVDKALRKKVM